MHIAKFAPHNAIMIYDFSNYRDIIRDVFKQRTSANRSYSMRAMARDLGLHSSRLSEILSGKQGLSSSRADLVGQKLHLAPTERDFFVLMVKKEHARSRAERLEAQKALESFFQHGMVSTMTPEEAKSIADWLHMAIIVCLAAVPRLSLEEISRRFSKRKSEVLEVVKRLERLNYLKVLLKKNRGGQAQDSPEVMPQDDKTKIRQINVPASCSAIRQLHSSLLEKALWARNSRPSEETFFSCTIMSFQCDQEQMDMAKKLIHQFSVDFNQLMAKKGGPKEKVFCFSSQLFSLED